MTETSMGFFCVPRLHLGVRMKPKMGGLAAKTLVYIRVQYIEKRQSVPTMFHSLRCREDAKSETHRIPTR